MERLTLFLNHHKVMEKDIKKNFSEQMQPTILRGDALAIERTSIDAIHGGEIYHITLQNELEVVCRVYDNGSTITMKYDADAGATQTIPKSYVAQIWKVVALCRFF